MTRPLEFLPSGDERQHLLLTYKGIQERFDTSIESQAMIRHRPGSEARSGRSKCRLAKRVGPLLRALVKQISERVLTHGKCSFQTSATS